MDNVETKETTMGELFEELIIEIKDLNVLEKKTIPEKFVKFAEEFGEFAAETVKMLGMSHKQYDRAHHVEEMADSLQVHVSTILSICEEKGIDFKEVLVEMKNKNGKWREKIPQYTKEISEQTKKPWPHRLKFWDGIGRYNSDSKI